MEFIIHKVNSIKKLNNIPMEYGCEIDIRTDGSKLILNHDPFLKGDNLVDYLDEYKNGTLVLNIKESGIEDFVLEEVRKRDIKSFFLLDVEFPYLFSASEKGEQNIAVRFSEKEPIENVNLFINKVTWIWIDTISKLPINFENIETLNFFNSCIVCPSRWGRESDIILIKNEIRDLGFSPTCIMTELKYIKYWV